MSATWPRSRRWASTRETAPTGGGYMPGRLSEAPAATDAPGAGAGTLPGRLHDLPLRIIPLTLLRPGPLGLGGRASPHLIERHARVYRHPWSVLISGFFEPLFY